MAIEPYHSFSEHWWLGGNQQVATWGVNNDVVGLQTESRPQGLDVGQNTVQIEDLI